MERQTVIVVDDAREIRDCLTRALRTRFDVKPAADIAHAIELARELRPRFATIDIRLPDGSGLKLLRELQMLQPAIRALVISGYASVCSTVAAMRAGAFGVLLKPVTPADVLSAFELDDVEPPTIATPSLARIEWEHIQRVLTDCEGNITAAAKKLGLHRQSLQRKLRKIPPNV